MCKGFNVFVKLLLLRVLNVKVKNQVSQHIWHIKKLTQLPVFLCITTLQTCCWITWVSETDTDASAIILFITNASNVWNKLHLSTCFDFLAEVYIPSGNFGNRKLSAGVFYGKCT